MKARQRSPFLRPRAGVQPESRRLDDRAMSPVEVAERLSVSLSTVWRLARQGKLGQQSKLGHRTTRFSARSVEALLEATKVQADTTA